MLCGIFLLTFALRAVRSATAYDVFHDETIYTRIGAGFALDHSISFAGTPFFLHPPLYFLVQGCVTDLFGIAGTAVDVVHSLRLLNAGIGAVVAVLILILIRSISSSLLWGVVASLVFALDPFLVRFDSRVFLETFTTMWIVAGYAVLVPVVPRSRGGAAIAARPAGELASIAVGHANARAAAAGVLFGLAVLSKETAVVLCGLPLVWSLIRSGPVPRPPASVALAAMVLTYLPYPIASIASGDGGEFFDQKFRGLSRLVGTVQETGFNRPGAPSFVSRITEHLDTFGVTYVVIGIGLLAAVWVVRRRSARAAFMAHWALAAFALLAYQVVLGTLEEQMFYYLVVPSIVVLTLAFSARPHVLGHRAVSAGVLSLVVAVAIFDIAVWVSVHGRDDTGMVRAVSWMEQNAPAGSVVAPLADGSQFLLPAYRLAFDPETTRSVAGPALAASGVHYVITSSLQAEQGYSAATPALLAWLRAHARDRFAVRRPTVGTITVWQLAADPPPDTAPPGPQQLRPDAPLSR
jgi:hypothetical protein